MPASSSLGCDSLFRTFSSFLIQPQDAQALILAPCSTLGIAELQLCPFPPFLGTVSACLRTGRIKFTHFGIIARKDFPWLLGQISTAESYFEKCSQGLVSSFRSEHCLWVLFRCKNWAASELGQLFRLSHFYYRVIAPQAWLWVNQFSSSCWWHFIWVIPFLWSPSLD